MFTLLSRVFIKNHKDITNPAVRFLYGVLGGSLGVMLNILLFVIKIIAGTISNSVAVTADAFNNLSDAASSVITLIGFKLSSKKPDSDHPFGHGRIEYISGLVVSFLIIMMGIELAKSSIDKIINPELLLFSPASAVILGVSIIIKFYMAYYNYTVGKRISSASMKATAADSISDCIATTFVLISMVFSHFTQYNIDPYCGALVSALIIYAGIRSVIDTSSPLLGQSADPETIEKIEGIVLSHEIALGIHDIIVHDYGNGKLIASLHVEVDSNGNILELHDEIDNIEREIKSTLDCDATIHMDPIVKDDPVLSELKNSVQCYLDTSPVKITIHDFRMVKGNTHTNIIFDAVLPYDYTKTEKLLTDLKALIQSYDSSFFAVINIDRKF